MKYFFEDKDIEEAMLKSCLLFNNKNIKNKRNHLFQKFLLSLIISGEVKNKDAIKRYIEEQHKSFFIDDGKIDSAIADMEKNGLIENTNGSIVLTPETQENAANYTRNIINQLDSLVDDIFAKVKIEYKKTISNPNQIKSNIKDCINYYYAVTGHSFFELDKKKEISKLPKLDEIASAYLKSSEKEELSEIIIYSTGSIIDKPTESQQKVLETLAKTYITTQIMDIDPLLNNFKSTIIKEKEFILDTDVVLYAITENAPFSKQYKIMISQLSSCGCKIYLPEEVVVEVYNHAEAAKKRYPFISLYMNNKAEWVNKEFKNIFIEDYYFTNQPKDSGSLGWETYIGNFYNPLYGSYFTLEQIKDKLGDNIIYGKMPIAKIEGGDQRRLEVATLEETNKTEKAVHREDEKNENIAKTDTMLYLSVKALNEINDRKVGKNPNERFDLLMNKYYVLTTSLRVHFCAKSLGLDANVLCKPLSLMAYLAETGIMAKDKIKITSLFDNPFLLHTAKVVWNDVKTLVKSGIDIKDKNIVRMRFDLQKEINDMLTDKTAEEYEKIYESVTRKGYTFEPMVEKIMEDSKVQNSRLELQAQEMAKMREEIRKRDEQLEKANKIIENKDKIISRKNYEDRIEKNNKKKRK